MAILKDVAKKLKKYAKRGVQIATYPVKKLSREYKPQELADHIKKLIPDKVTLEEYNKIQEKYNKDLILKKYYNPKKDERKQTATIGFASVIMHDIYKAIIPLADRLKTESDSDFYHRLEGHIKRPAYLKETNVNKLTHLFKDTQLSLSDKKDVQIDGENATISGWTTSIMFSKKVAQAIVNLNTYLNKMEEYARKMSDILKASELTKAQMESKPPKVQAPRPIKAKFTHPNKSLLSLPLPDGPAPQPPKAESVTKTKQTSSNAPASKQTSSIKSETEAVLTNSISDIFLSLKFEKKLTPEEQPEFDALKKYFKDNAQNITDKIINLKNDQTRNDWVEYFINKPFSKMMTYDDFRNYLYGKNGLFQEMLKDGIRVNGPIPKNLPKGVKLPAQKQPSEPSAPQPKSAPQKTSESAATSSTKENAIKTAASAAKTAEEAAKTAEKAAKAAEEVFKKVDPLKTDNKTFKEIKYDAELTQDMAKRAQNNANSAQDLASKLATDKTITDQEAQEAAKKAQNNAKRAQDLAKSAQEEQQAAEKSFAIANAAAAATSANAAAETAKEAAEKAKELNADKEKVKKAQEAAKKAIKSADIAQRASELAAEAETTVQEAQRAAAAAQKRANEAQEAAEIAKEAAGITDDDDVYDD